MTDIHITGFCTKTKTIQGTLGQAKAPQVTTVVGNKRIISFPSPLGDLRERRKLPQQDPGDNLGPKQIWCPFSLTKRFRDKFWWNTDCRLRPWSLRL